MDPLNALLHDAAMDDPAAPADDGTAQDWSHLSTLWDGADPKYPELMDFNDLSSLRMDMEFDSSMGLDASTMHYDALRYSYDNFNAVSTELLPPPFPFTFQAAINASTSSFSSGASSSGSSTNGKERRLSVTSTSSSSGASFSPATDDNSPSPPSEPFSSQPATPKMEVKKQEESPIRSYDPALELAEQVRQTAGVMLAVPMSAQLQAFSQALDLPQQNMQSKMPIPRLPRPSASPKSPQSSSSSAASTPPPSTPPMSSALPSKLTIDTKPISVSSSTLPTPTTAIMPSGSSGRPKTSHTTIERRYRTNLNARIQSLRMAVPALRVLEDRDGGNGKKIKKNLKDGVYLKGAGIGIDGEDGTVDVIDERGFVDGVKVARKCSKANVLGKAVEYIRVLKKREIRLKTEHNGLKALLCGLVGGPALLKEWEQRWRERFGGEEKDEVEGEEAEDFDSDEEDGEDGDEEVGKKRKRAKTSSNPSGASLKKAAEKRGQVVQPPPSVANVITQLGGTAPGAPAVTEKRKRGRPRKVPAPPTSVVTLAPQGIQPAPLQDVMMQPEHVMFRPNLEQQQQQHQHSQPQQYLLAVFALFSFFNSPLTASYGSSGSNHQQHTGVLLNPPLALSPDIISQFTPPAPPVESAHMMLLGTGWSWRECVQGFHLLVSMLVLASFVCSWMGISLSLSLRKKQGMKQGLKRGADGSVDWSAVCHETVLNRKAKPLSLVSSAQMYMNLLSTKTPSISQLTSTALALSQRHGRLTVFNSLARAKARSLWATAKAQAELSTVLSPSKRTSEVKLWEKLVLESWQLDEAVKQLDQVLADGAATTTTTTTTPIKVLGALLVRQRVRQHLGALFVEAVGVSSAACSEERADKEDKVRVEAVSDAEEEIRKTVDAARELGGDVEELGRTLERVWKASSGVLLDQHFPRSYSPLLSEEEEGSGETQLETEIKSLLTALVLYKRLFAGPARASFTSALISPPPSPTNRSSRSAARVKGENVLLDLRKALGSRVFEEGEGEMEVARDRVVDLIVDMERRGRSVSPS